ncbi:MAG: indole-3-glycerol phosphate synthase TrpC [Coriobacteriales bacterium]|nr:indole-3-glycerol phosphate synthase TrpC [Coriobacteriales bacterium]
MAAKENILKVIADHNRRLVSEAQERVSKDELAERAFACPSATGYPFEEALARPGLSFICEVKRASPSKGVIAADFDHLAVARSYEAAGADAISCLTEPKWFLGSLDYLADIARETTTPVMRKDFVVDSYQLYEAKLAGASAVLLLCGVLDDEQLSAYLELCKELGLSALVEAYDEDELRRAVAVGAHMIGVNNRNLKDFSVDFAHAQRMRELVPADRLYVAESGVASLDDVATIARMGADAALVGEFLMRAGDKSALLSEMRASAEEALRG